MLNRIKDEWATATQTPPGKSVQAPRQRPDASTDWGQRAETWMGRVEKLIATHPGWSMAVGVAAGALLGWWVKRK